ncbi:cyclic peptide export ABC transporter [Rivularia sp. UHCC 0363]|uniref:cyclic peptide export ABC transporter n=1 Tax=Rivularia sp. UHCC 0363 TaxID=3110244 RepID=UPI002B203FB6|nr:cyclic peptide export ABC transporter [Rivularia sp. UHCC 0363]MEA5595603.1 cyclic peptide export ABC transporter [Rivularia sp. UHCC 0363]
MGIDKSSLPQIAQANIALNKIESLGISLSEQVTEPNFPTGSDFESNWTSLELVNVSHAYGGESEEHQFTLDNINLKFEPGELVFIVGANGSGKSTLVKLITGLYVPDNGQILFNNRPVTDDNREWYRQQFSVVFYDFYLFARLLGIEENRETEIQNYLTLLELERKVTVKDGVLSTINLSQGQRKRLALLTAYLENRPIYVFDEWASDQDPVFKEIFYNKLLPELKQRGKTVIAISHDDLYFNNCDRLIKLDYGRVVENRAIGNG